ncbi:hypothetical protein Dimus_031385 [Dionaea muscipula]
MAEKDILHEARELYKVKTGKNFTHDHAWRLLRDEPKWKTIKGQAKDDSSSPKRTKISESGAYSSSSNPDDPEVREFQRPIGRDEKKYTTPQLHAEAIAFRAWMKQREIDFQILMANTFSMNQQQLRIHERLLEEVNKRLDSED